MPSLQSLLSCCHPIAPASAVSRVHLPWQGTPFGRGLTEAPLPLTSAGSETPSILLAVHAYTYIVENKHAMRCTQNIQGGYLLRGEPVCHRGVTWMWPGSPYQGDPTEVKMPFPLFRARKWPKEMGFSVFTFFIMYQKCDVLLSSSHSVYQMALKHYLVAIAINCKAISYISINVINFSVLPNTLAFGSNTQALDSFCRPPLLCFFPHPCSLQFL